MMYDQMLNSRLTFWRTERIFLPFLIGKFQNVQFSQYLSLVQQSIALLVVIITAIG